ncbi:helix-turn-helix domain-containing protein [Novosphingobium malaysiense]|uniref:helix-turn-helix domain-containing protein n=1 Tax=Novosphingobium malaysiense TaxID=1348853 RepID=UPI0018CDF8F8|nr:AraC family transcriptional regulator [Novosphingobium malaysiense]
MSKSIGGYGPYKIDLERLFKNLENVGVCREDIHSECQGRLIEEPVCGIKPEIWNLHVILNSVAGMAAPGIGLKLGKSSYLTEYGSYYQRLRGCETMEDTRKAVKHFHDLSMQPHFYQDRVEQGEWQIKFGLPLAPGPGATVLFEELIAKTKYECEHFLGTDISFKRIELPYQEPAHRSEYEDLLGCRVIFGRPCMMIVFSQDVLDRPSAVRSPRRAALADEDWDAALMGMSLGDRVAAAILEQLVFQPGTYPSLQQVADTFGRSTSTVKRWLSEETLNYRALVDLVRREHVAEYLTFTDIAPKEIAHRLGFTNVHNFRRAFRRWMDMMPGEFRRLMAQESAFVPVLRPSSVRH